MEHEMICVKKCLICEVLFKTEPYPMTSFDDSMMWTDGKVVGPHYVPKKYVVCCPSCRTPCLVGKIETVAEFDEYPDAGSSFEESEYASTPDARYAGIQDYLRLLRRGGHSGEDELYIRVELMQLWNDRRRNAFGPDISEVEIENLRAITALIEPKNTDDILLLGEVYRELGCFDISDRVLALAEPATNPWAMFLRYLASRKDSNVQEFHRVPEYFAKRVAGSFKMTGMN